MKDILELRGSISIPVDVKAGERSERGGMVVERVSRLALEYDLPTSVGERESRGNDGRNRSCSVLRSITPSLGSLRYVDLGLP